MSGSSSLLGRVPEIYTKVIEHFLPRWVAEDREAANQARMFGCSCSAIPSLVHDLAPRSCRRSADARLSRSARKLRGFLAEM